jgi:hypothetical protein
MANVDLKVTVLGGITPFSIKASLYKGKEFVMGLTSPGSFDHVFKNLDGNYTILVNGTNPMGQNGKTRCEINSDKIELKEDSDPSPTTRTGKSYLVQFHFKTL